MELLSEIEGKIVIFLQELNRDLDIDSYCASIKEDEINAINSPTKRWNRPELGGTIALVKPINEK